MLFSLGIYAGIICTLCWIGFDQYFLNKWNLFKQGNKWLKSSYRRSAILTLAVGSGYLGLMARVLDLANALVGSTLVFIMVAVYNCIIVSKNKIFRKEKNVSSKLHSHAYNSYGSNKYIF